MVIAAMQLADIPSLQSGARGLHPLVHTRLTMRFLARRGWKAELAWTRSSQSDLWVNVGLSLSLQREHWTVQTVGVRYTFNAFIHMPHYDIQQLTIICHRHWKTVQPWHLAFDWRENVYSVILKYWTSELSQLEYEQAVFDSRLIKEPRIFTAP